MPIVREHDSIQHRLPGSTFHSFAAPASGSTELCAWRVEVAGGTPGIEHRVSREEVFLLLTGELVVTLDGVTASLMPGEVLVVPAGAQLKVDNAATAAATAWVTTSVGLEATLPDGSLISPPWVR